MDNEGESTLGSITTEIDHQEPFKFLVGSWFLRESFEYCTQSRQVGDEVHHHDEWVHYATGIAVNGVRTVDRIVTFPFVQQSASYVEGDAMATRDVLIRMSDYGYALHAVCHSHPGYGPGSTRPSGIDLDHQERLERGSYCVISCIYSRDGYARFFTVNLPFEVEVYGEGVEQYAENVFHLSEGN